MIQTEALTHVVAKAVRDFYHYFNTLDNPKLEEWIEDAIRRHLEADGN